MTREFYERVRDIYARARDVDFTARQQWLALECGGDDMLRLEVESLLYFAPKLELPRRMRDVQLLDQGGFAKVFAAVDNEWGPVAVKKLLNEDGHSIQRFKNEFRLRYQRHANLVTLFGLIEHEGEWLLVMERLEGETLRTALDRGNSEWGYARTHAVIAQIAAGLNALHRNEILHRDLKPGNVWLKAGDQVVLLDFGLAKKSDRPTDDVSEGLFGTRGYVAPERMQQAGDSKAGDWYSVGVILWEMLCGPLPENRFRRNQATFPSGTPFALSKLCVGLLHRDADQRAGSREVAAYLAEEAPARVPNPDDERLDCPRLVGRDHEFSRLQQYLREVRDGHPVCVFLTGGTGTGKTELAEAFLDSVSPWALSLRGRCYEAESVSYKACDGLVDDLAARLRGMPREKRNELLPHNVAALEKAFPVLRDVWPHRPALAASDSAEAVRDLAFLALRELIARVAEGRSVVLFVDDLHWGDIDSALVLSALLSGAGSPSVLFLFTWRDEPQLARLPTWLLDHEKDFRVRVERIALGPLAEADSDRIAKALLGDQGLQHQLIAEITRVSEGNPFLIHELAAGVRLRRDEPDTPAPSNALEALLSAAMTRRVNSMSAAARAILGVIAVAGEALPDDIVQSVSAVGWNYARARAELLEMRVARAVSCDRQTDLDIYHVRQRETATAVTGVNREKVHGEIAEAFMTRDEPQKVVHHLRYSSDTSLCAHFAQVAGDRAFGKLAFRQAAALYQETVDWLAAKNRDSNVGEALLGPYRKLAEALAAAGLGSESAAAYRNAALAAGKGQDGTQLSMRVLAAGQLLNCGALADGLAAFRQVSAEVGVPYPRYKTTLYFSILWLRVRLRARGLRPGTRGDPSPRRRIQMDTCWTGLIGTSMLETSRSAAYSARHLLWALDAGEPRRLSRALAAEAAILSAAAFVGMPPHALLEKARELDRESEDSPETAFIRCMTCIVAFNQGDWPGCLTEGARALATYKERGSGGGWERVTATTYWLSARIMTGDWKGASADLPVLLRDGAARGDKFAAVNLRLLSNCLWAELGAGRAAEARQIARQLHREWGQPRFDMQRFCSEMIRIDCDLYEGDYEQAWQAFLRAEAEMSRSELWHVRVLRERLAYTGACSAIASASSGPQQNNLKAADGYSNRLIRTGRRYATGLGELTKAGIASLRGEFRVAEVSLRIAQGHFIATGMKPMLAVCEARLAALAGEHREIPWFKEQGIDSAEKLSNTLAPGRWVRY